MSGKGKIKGKYDSSDTRGTLERSIQSVMWSKDAFDSKLFKQQRKPPYTLPSYIFYACKLFAVHFILILAAFVCFRSPYGLQLMFSITVQNIAIVSLLSFILCIIQFISRAIASIPISFHVIMSDIRYGFKLFLVTLALAAISVIGLYLLGSGQLPYNTQSVRKEIFVPSVVLWVLWFVAYKIVSCEFFTRNGFISDTDNQQHGVVVNINWCFSFILCISWLAYDNIYDFDSDTSERRRSYTQGELIMIFVMLMGFQAVLQSGHKLVLRDWYKWFHEMKQNRFVFYPCVLIAAGLCFNFVRTYSNMYYKPIDRNK